MPAVAAKRVSREERLNECGAAVAEVDAAFATHALFGCSERILAKVFARYRFGLDLFAERLPSIAPAVAMLGAADDSALRPLFFDIYTRRAIEQAFRDLENGTLRSPHALETILPRAVAALPAGLCEAQMPARWYVAAPEPVWLWGIGGNVDDFAAQDLRAALDSMDRANRLRAPDAAARRTVDEAVALLLALLPRAGAGALRHVGCVALIDSENTLSFTGGDAMPSTIFLAPDRLDDFWELTECLFHEALHTKLFDAIRSLSLTRSADATIQVPWRSTPWHVPRAIFSYHVYAHLALFRAAAACADGVCIARFGDPARYLARAHPSDARVGDGRYDRAIDRARFFGERLGSDWSALLTDEGRAFVRWLTRALEPIDELFD